MTNENWNALAPETKLQELKNMGAFFDSYEKEQCHTAATEAIFQQIRAFFLRLEMDLEPGIDAPISGYDRFTWRLTPVEHRIRNAGNIARNYFGLKHTIEVSIRKREPLLLSQAALKERYAKAETMAERLFLKPNIGSQHGTK